MVEKYEQRIQELNKKIQTMTELIENDYLTQIARYKVIVREYEKDISSLKKEVYSLRENLTPQNCDYIERANPWFCVYCGILNSHPLNDYLCLHCQKIRPFIGLSSTLVKCIPCSQFNFSLASFCEWCGNEFFRTQK
ncbi:hypothetical protein [Candidatus Uabimicrobium sp. HlEnr_7]|uniref:hypothetical protein n=1 Tax=Candidatus Uabimicrobium helgolandensis TaxID=3095367 RepID=UPI0035592867